MAEREAPVAQAPVPETVDRRSRRDRVQEIVAVFMLSIMAVATAWCGFESSKWSGAMSISFSQASSARVKSSEYASEARDARQFDLSVYTQWVLAKANGETALAEYIQERFSTQFALAFDAWTKEGMKENSPLTNKAYIPPGTAQAAHWSRVADTRYDQALTDNARGDQYSLLTVLFALVLFLTAMSQRDITKWGSLTLLGLGGIAAIAGIVLMFSYPILV
ncbi:hypothetical protein ACX9R5_00055 [Rathayibacter sp. CAU 1779]